MSVDNEENTLLEIENKCYKSRWWILLVTSLHFMHQNIGLNTWGPIAQSAKAVYGWEDTTIAFILNMGRLGSLLFILAGCCILHKKGLRISMLLYAMLMMASNSLRCLPSNKDTAIWIMTIAEALNGANGVTTMAATALITSVWFPQRERITATAISVMSAYVGDGVSSIVGPVIVAEPVYLSKVQLETSPASNSSLLNKTISRKQVVNVEQMSADIRLYMYIQCAFSGLLLLATLVYFPSKPPTAPSNSAAMPRIHWKQIAGELIRRRWLFVLLLAFGTVTGIYMSWICVLDIVFYPLGLSQIDAGWLGFITVIGGALLGTCIARFLDKFAKKLKPVLLCVYILITLTKTWTALIGSRIIPFNKVQLYVSSAIGGGLVNASFPLLYELVCEMSFPLPEEIINGVVDTLFLLFANGFYVMMYFPVRDYTWLPWVLVVGAACLSLLLLVYPVSYIRTDIDLGSKKDIPDTTNTNGFNMEVIKQWQQ